MDDQLIIDGLCERNESSLQDLRIKYEGRLFKTAYNFLNNSQDAEECVSDTLLKAWNNIPPQRPDMLGAYLAKIARNLALNKLKAKNTQKRGGERTAALEELAYTLPASYHTTPEGVYDANQTTQAINTFLDGVKKTERMVFVLRYFYGESVLDIAERLAYSESKVKSLLFRTRKKLKLHLEKEGVLV